MKQRLTFIASYFIFWVISFVLVRMVFIVLNAEFAAPLTVTEVLSAFTHGLKLDLSSASYVSLIPFLLLIVGVLFPAKWQNKTITIYSVALIVLLAFLTVADACTYPYWGHRIDASAILYVSTPQSAIASIEIKSLIFQILAFLAIAGLLTFVYYKLIRKQGNSIDKGRWFEVPVFLVLFASLIIPIRGGFGMPLNTGTAYFSDKEFANHASINLMWHIGYSITESETMSNPYKTMDDAQAAAIIERLYSKDNGQVDKLLKVKHPNVIFLVLESFTAKLIEPMGGLKGVTPHFNQLIHEGVFFNHLYASGTRSDKGLVAAISGYPALPNTAIIRFPDKTAALPSLAKDLMKQGYQSAYYYGGDIDFASMRSYVVNMGYQKIVSETDFPESTYARWGVHDHVMFERFFDDINKSRKPLFYTVFTLSNHEPYDVPMKPKFAPIDVDHKFMNSMYYTDSCLYAFIQKAKQTSWWDSTLIVMVADHSTINPFDTPNWTPQRYEIPMLWVGGALKTTDTVITKVCSQVDIPHTVLAQLDVTPSKPYLFSQNILSSQAKPLAFCVYNNGVGAFTDTEKVTYDFDERQVKYSDNNNNDMLLRRNLAFMQYLYNSFMFIK